MLNSSELNQAMLDYTDKILDGHQAFYSFMKADVQSMRVIFPESGDPFIQYTLE